MPYIRCGTRHGPIEMQPTLGDLGLKIAVNGSYRVHVWCRMCRAWSWSAIANTYVEALGARPADLPLISDQRGRWGRCMVRDCDNEDVEFNHFAPQAIFGDEAYLWPIGMLCRAHHQEWGERVTPQLNKPRRTA